MENNETALAKCGPVEIVRAADRRIDAADLQRLVEIWLAIGPRARQLWLDIGDRFVMGNKQYGDFDDKPRDWLFEADQELMDGIVYLAMFLRQRMERKK